MSRYFLDTEFIESPGSIQLISIGIVASDGREYYAVSSEYNYDDADDWVKENVLADVNKYLMNKSLKYNPLYNTPVDRVNKYWGTAKHQIRNEILAFIGDDKKPRFYGYYCDYDWVVFCWIFGKMIDLPKNFPHYCRDLKQYSDTLGLPSTMSPAHGEGQHNALDDARWNFEFFKVLQDYNASKLRPINI